MPDPSENTVRLTRMIKASPKRVFQAWTDAKQFAQWFKPTAEIKQVVMEMTPSVGGVFRVGYTDPETGHVNRLSCEYLEVDPPRKLVFTWSWLSPHSEFTEEQLAFESVVTVDFAELDGQTQVTVTHKKLPTGNITERHIWGWNGALDQLVGYIDH